MLLCSVTPLCPTLCDPMDWSPAGCVTRGIFQQKYYCRVPFPPAGVLPNSVMETGSRALTGRFFTTEPARKSTYIQVSYTNLQVENFWRYNMHLVPGRKQNLWHQYQVWVALQLALVHLLHLLPSVRCSWWPCSSSISLILSLLQSVTLLDSSPLASPCMPAGVLGYCTFQGPAL